MADHSHDPTLIPPTITFLSPPRQTGDIGHLAQYRILKQLGRGGMGVVYQGLDTELNRVAALKVMHPEYAANEEARLRFKREAQAAAKLKHDHIVTIYQVSEERQIPFLAMEYLSGKSLEEWLRPDRRASVAETLLIGKQIAKGLAAAHKAGLIHRDIKPANLWLEAPRGRVKILDFGLARNAAPDKGDLTQYGVIVGTPAYMAPEQARGEAVDHRCDLFSLGCVLYRMLVGRLPFQGDSTFAILSAIATETPPPLSQLRPEIPAQLSDLVAKLLAKKPQERPKSAQAVFEELVEIERESKLPSVPPLTPQTTRGIWLWTMAGSGVLAILLIGLVAYWLGGRQKLSEPDPIETIRPKVITEQESKLESPFKIDLLALVELQRDATPNWSVPEPGRLLARAKERPFVLRLPWNPPREYRLRFTATRQPRSGQGGLRIGLSQGDSRFGLIVDMKHEKRVLTGLHFIDNVSLEKRRDGRWGLLLLPGQKVELTMTVREGEFTAEANGTTIYTWSGDLGRATRQFRSADVPLLIMGSDAAFAFEEISLEPLGQDIGEPVLEPPGGDSD